MRTRRFRSDQIAAFASVTFGLPLFNLDALDPGVIPKGSVDPKLLSKHRVLPITLRGNRLFVAISDPSNLKALDDIKFQTSLAAEPVVVEDRQAWRYGWTVSARSPRTASCKPKSGSSSSLTTKRKMRLILLPPTTLTMRQVVKYLQKMLLDAINSGASDIHFEPYQKNYRIRYRMDGMLYEVAQPPLAIEDKIASRIKVISKLDISEKRVPAGWPHEVGVVAREIGRFPGFYTTHHLWREDRHAYSGFHVSHDGHQRLRVRAG